MAYIVFKPRGKKTYIALRRVEYKGFGRFRRRLVNEEYLSGRCFVFIGGRGTGKTRELRKLNSRSVEVFGRRAVLLNGAEGIDNWFKRAGLSEEELKGLKQFEKIELLVEKARNRPVLIDNIDRVSSRVKTEAVKRLISVSSFAAVAAESEKRIDVGIIQALRAKQGLRRFERLKAIHLGQREEEIKDIGGVIAIVFVFVFGLVFGVSEALLGALGIRYLSREGRRW
jgi:hypothetical protein